MATKCTNCLLPQIVPNTSLNSEDVCNFCTEYSFVDLDLEESVREKRREDLESALENCRGKGQYDVLVNLSGGKDSCLLLHKLKKEYGRLNVLAFTTDMNIPEVAWKNIRRTVELLDVAHVVFKPPAEFYRKMFRYLLQNQEERGAVRTVCYVCAPLFEGYSLKVAIEKEIPLVVAGYSPGQPEPDRMVYEFSGELLSQDWTPPELRDCGLFDEDELDLFWNPTKFSADTKIPRYLAPFHAWPYSQDEAMKLVVELGLISNKRSANPIHSNCPVNWLLMYSDLEKLGYNPYAPEFSQLIREGKASRTQWRFLTPIVNFMIRRRIFLGRNVTKSLNWLGMKAEELQITRAASGPEYHQQNQNDSESLTPAAGVSDSTSSTASSAGIP